MKVTDVINELKKFNPEAEITTPFSETITFSWISDDSADIKESKQTTSMVFIEPADWEEEC